jgi:hypothetical protein
MWEERAQLKATLYRFALEHHQSVPNFIRNKLVKLVVDIARLDWPHFYPDFFSNILQVKGINKEYVYFVCVCVCVCVRKHTFKAPQV